MIGRMLPETGHCGLLIIGHRGAAGHAPENTLAGFASAVALGVDGVELDVQMAGSEVVVLHDKTLDRTTDGTGPITAMSFDELRGLDAGEGQRIPTLVEVFDVVPRGLLLNVELKGPGTAEPVSRLVRGRATDAAPATVPTVLVSSFDHQELARFHRICPDVPCAPLAGSWTRRIGETAASLDAWSINLADRAATAGRVATIRGWGRRCLVYTVNDPTRACQLRDIGVTGVFTDYPDRYR